MINKSNRKVNLIENAIVNKKIPLTDRPKYMKHKTHHTLQHLLNMIKFQNQGKNFFDAHKLAKDLEKKKTYRKKI